MSKEVADKVIAANKRHIEKMSSLAAQYSAPGVLYGDRVITVNDYELYVRDNGYALSPVGLTKPGEEDVIKEPGRLLLTPDTPNIRRIARLLGQGMGYDNPVVEAHSPRTWAEAQIVRSQETIELCKEYQERNANNV